MRAKAAALFFLLGLCTLSLSATAAGSADSSRWIGLGVSTPVTFRDDNGFPGTLMTGGYFSAGVEFGSVGVALNWHESDIDSSEDHFRILGEQSIYGLGLTYRLDDGVVPLWFASNSHLVLRLMLQRGWARYEFKSSDTGSDIFNRGNAWGSMFGLAYETQLWRALYAVVDLAYENNRFSNYIPANEKNYWDAILTASLGITIRF